MRHSWPAADLPGAVPNRLIPIDNLLGLHNIYIVSSYVPGRGLHNFPIANPMYTKYFSNPLDFFAKIVYNYYRKYKKGGTTYGSI